MTDQHRQNGPDRRALVSAFAGHVSAARAGGGAKILAAVLVAALAGGVVVGVGYLTRPAKKHPVTASALGRPTATAAAGLAPSRLPGIQTTTPAPGQTVTGQPGQAAPGQAAPGQTVAGQPGQAAPGQAAPGQAVTGQTTPGQPAIAGNSAPVNGQPGAPARTSAGTALPQAAAANLAASTPRFAAVTGYGCASSTKATFTEHGRWTDGLNGFISVRSGGLRADGCNGSFDAMPMSGSTTYADPSNYALWTFRTGPVVHGVCHINVYIPNDANIEHVGGNPAVYQVFDSAGTAGPELGSFGIGQISSRGHWVSRHNWRITSGALTVRLDSYGIDWSGNTPTHAHIAISAVSLTCES